MKQYFSCFKYSSYIFKGGGGEPTYLRVLNILCWDVSFSLGKLCQWNVFMVAAISLK